jgi:hypothetical protein
LCSAKRLAKKQKIDDDEGRDNTDETEGQHVPHLVSGYGSARFGHVVRAS